MEAANRYWGFDAIRNGRLADYAAASPHKFDTVICNQVFERLAKPRDVGEALVSLLKPSGVLSTSPSLTQCSRRN